MQLIWWFKSTSNLNFILETTLKLKETKPKHRIFKLSLFLFRRIFLYKNSCCIKFYCFPGSLFCSFIQLPKTAETETSCWNLLPCYCRLLIACLMCEYWSKKVLTESFSPYCYCPPSCPSRGLSCNSPCRIFRNLYHHLFQVQENIVSIWERKAVLKGVTEVSVFRWFICCLLWKAKA